jgi:DNA-binding transcriptional LysR family regulator
LIISNTSSACGLGAPRRHVVVSAVLESGSDAAYLEPTIFGSCRSPVAMLPFTFRQIEVFLEICRAGNFRRAADHLQISQPAISNQIKSLEEQLGKELFLRRRGASCVLSADGRAFKESAEQFFQQAQSLGREARRGSARPKPLRVFVGGHLLEDYVRPALEQFHLQHPHLTLEFLPQYSRAELLEDIQRGQVDVALATCRFDEDTPATHSLGTVEAGIQADLADVPFVLPPNRTPAARSVCAILRRLGISSPRVAATTQYHDVLVRMACEGQGAIFSIQSIVDRHDCQRRLKRVVTSEPWERRIYVAPHVDPAHARSIVDFLQKSIPTPTV